MQFHANAPLGQKGRETMVLRPSERVVGHRLTARAL
jgi:hypothetical protein